MKQKQIEINVNTVVVSAYNQKKQTKIKRQVTIEWWRLILYPHRKYRHRPFPMSFA